MNIQTAISPTIDFESIKARQQGAWASGDYAMVGTTLQIVGEALCEAIDLRSNQRVLDVAAGNGNATLAAARRFADVTSTDYVAALLERGRERARTEGLNVTFQQAAWGSGDYAMIGTTLQIVGETLCEAIDLRSNQRVLDVAAGNGNATLAAARRFADVVSTDYVGSLLERGRERAKAERL